MIDTQDYNIDVLGKRAIAIPGKEPKLNKTGGIIPVCEPDLSSSALKYATEAIKSTWISSRGKYLDEFEKLFAKKVGAKYAVAVNSGTSALACAVATLGIKRGDRVVIPSFTMISTVFAISYLGAIPVFVDCDEYYQMDVRWLALALRTFPNIKLILPVHIYGHPVNIGEISKLAKQYNIPVIYDAAEAHGALYRGKPIGGQGIASCYSFYANKIITTGEGGMVVSNNKEFIDICRNLKDVAFSHERHFWHKRLGYNFRMTNLCAAIGVAQVERFDELVNAHIKNAKYYRDALSQVSGLGFAKEAKWAKNVYWMFGIEVLPEFGMTRDQLRKFLADRGIETRTYFVPMHLQPYYAKKWKKVEMPMSEHLSETGMYLPSSSRLTKKQMDKVISAIKEAYKHVH